MSPKNQTADRPAQDPVELVVNVVSDRWTFLILREAFFGVRRYGELQRNLGIARNVLADRLKRLVADGMFERVRYRTDPDWYEYRLTERALDLYPLILGLMGWANRHVASPETAAAMELIHRPCGHRAEPSLACAHCGEALDAREVEVSVRAPAPAAAPSPAAARLRRPRPPAGSGRG